jgi:hypothetical protein
LITELRVVSLTDRVFSLRRNVVATHVRDISRIDLMAAEKVTGRKPYQRPSLVKTAQLEKIVAAGTAVHAG